MNKEIWLKSSFNKKANLSWLCPNCSNPTLKLGAFQSKEIAESLERHQDEYWEPEFIQYSFSGNLNCSECQEFVAFVGNGREEFLHYYDETLGYHIEENFSLYMPKFFYPVLQLFPIPYDCPESIKQTIQDSFSTYWNDLNSCANKIRVTLELLMNEFKIKKTIINKKKKRQRLSLHQRIQEFKNKKPDEAELLLAIKWIGNSGSHIGKLEKIDILETYEMLEFTLNKLYNDKEAEVKKIAKEIIKRKGRRKR